jgi:mono/diheme cytochrome c family protein
MGICLCSNQCTHSGNRNAVEDQDFKNAFSGYDTAYIGQPLADPLMQQNKETFVLYGCAYCHGIDLVPVGEATDLRTSAIVSADVNANAIGPILRKGIPQTPKSSPMPQFSDLSDREIKGIASYIHYARARSRFADLSHGSDIPGDSEEGKLYFEAICASCHTGSKDLAGIGSRHEASRLREEILHPSSYRNPRSYKIGNADNEEFIEGRRMHQILLENHSEPNVSNLVAYLQMLK